MRMKFSILVGALSGTLALSSVPALVDNAFAACSPYDHVNGTTAADATRAMESAGYTQIQVYAEGCDSAWHAHAMQNGRPVDIVWNNAGQILPEQGSDSAYVAPATTSTYPFSPGYSPTTGVTTTTYTGVVTTPSGQTVYTSEQDVPGRSNCYGECLLFWQPVYAPPGAVPTGSYTVITRADGRMQWATATGMPLYTYAYDRAPGDTSGNSYQGAWRAGYITASGTKTVTQGAAVAMQPAANARIVGAVNAGARVAVLDDNGSWAHIQAPGIDGYIPSGSLR